MPKWTVIVEERDLPACPLVLDAASVPPDELPQAIAILENLVLETHSAGKSANPHQDRRSVAPVGAPNEEGSILEIFSRITGKVPEDVWNSSLPACQRMSITTFTEPRGMMNEEGLCGHELLDRPPKPARRTARESQCHVAEAF